MMTETDIQIFLNGALDYFHRVSETDAQLDTPYLRSAENVLFDYTGAISISGAERGCVMFTAQRPMVRDLLARLGDDDFSEANCRDLVGEVANTISGNARRALGSGFSISVPWVLDSGSGERGPNPTNRTFVIPIHWNQHRSHLLVALET